MGQPHMGPRLPTSGQVNNCHIDALRAQEGRQWRRRAVQGKAGRTGGHSAVGGQLLHVWAHVARYATLRAFLAHCAVSVLKLRQMDVQTAFLNGPVTEEIYMQ